MFNNCYCNVCTTPMYRDKPEHGSNACSAFCRAVLTKPRHKRERDADKKPLRISRVRPVFACTPWPVPRHIERTYNPTRALRVRGSKNHERLTTKEVV